MAVTIKDIAQLANTSTATVSRVLSNKPGVTEEKRERIIKLAESLGYTPNRLAKNLAMRKSYTLGLIAADLRNPWYIAFLREIQRRVAGEGYQVLLADSEREAEKERLNIELMQEHRAEGLLIFPVADWRAGSDIDHLLQLKLRRFPFVIVGKIDGYQFDSVTSEEVDVAGELTRHLLDLGHRRIGFVGANPANRCIRERLDGVDKALRKAGLPLDPRDIIADSDTWIEDMVARLQQPDRPTALVMINAVYALMAQRPLHQAGLSVPNQLSLVTFDDDIWARHLLTSITTTEESTEGVAEHCLDLLFKRMEDANGSPEQRLVPQKMIVRESSGPPPAD